MQQSRAAQNGYTGALSPLVQAVTRSFFVYADVYAVVTATRYDWVRVK
jgi:hypothetical protein